MNIKLFAAAISMLSIPLVTLSAQQVQVGTPFQTVGDEYFERIGIDFGFTIPNSGPFRGNRSSGVFGLTPTGQINPNGIQFSQNSAALTRPTLGGYDPSGDAHIGFAVRGRNGGGFNLGISASKGSSRSLNSVTPSVVTQNGVPGTIFSGTQQPFVTGFIPVVGNSAPVTYVSPIDVALHRMKQQGQTLNSMRAKIIDEQREIKAAQQQQVSRTASTEKSSANSGALSLDEIRRLKAERKSAISDEIDELVKQVDTAEAEGRFGTARTLLNQAIRKSAGQTKVDLQERYATLRNRR